MAAVPALGCEEPGLCQVINTRPAEGGGETRPEVTLPDLELPADRSEQDGDCFPSPCPPDRVRVPRRAQMAGSCRATAPQSYAPLPGASMGGVLEVNLRKLPNPLRLQLNLTNTWQTFLSLCWRPIL